jgi:predicted XRE-type DNA-binding protein
MARTRLQRSTDNVFRDLGFGPEEAASLTIRADLMIEIERLMKRRRLTQAAAGKLLGVSQPRVSDLVRGKIELFSIDTLVDMLTRAGVRVRINVRRSHGKAKDAKAA